MSNGIKFTFLLSVILIVMFSMTFAQGVPFQAEVTVSVARMRWGPGPAYVVQHYANLGHVLTVLEADAESDPPWTWYYARTPSGVQSWIRGDLIRRTDAPVPVVRVDAPTGTYPVVDNNLCNTTLFWPCQDGTDHDLWEAGYWANDRYDQWERGGWNLDIVYHQNPCISDRLCTTRESWDAGRVEAELLAVTATPEVTLTPVVIIQTVEVGLTGVWETRSVMGSSITLGDDSDVDLYYPPLELKTDADEGSIFGGFRLSGSEEFEVYCHHWYLTASDALVKQPRQRVNLNELPTSPDDDGIRFGDNKDESNVKCFSSIDEHDVVARKWDLTLTRSYGSFAGISDVTWKLTATYGNEPTNACTREIRCTVSLLQTWRENLDDYYTGAQPTATEPAPRGFRLARELFLGTFSGQICSGRIREEGIRPNRKWDHQYTCRITTGDSRHKLTFHFTYRENRTVAPTPTPEESQS